MYKVFFKDRIVFFDDNFSSTFKNNSGLFYKYNGVGELKEIIDAFFKLDKIKHLFIIHKDLEILKSKFASCFLQVQASGGLVKRNNQDFLMIFKNGIWDLPKGKNDPGETSEVAALREVSEECGLNELSIKEVITKTYHVYLLNNKPVLKETTWFEMNSTDKQEPVPQAIENITKISWMEAGDINSVLSNTYPSIIEVLKANELI